MGPEAENAVATVLNVLGFAFCLVNLVGLGIVWDLSRAGKVRTFESKVYAQLENAGSRIERLESQWLEEKAALTAIADEMVTTADRTAKERRRLYSETKRAEMMGAAEQNQVVDMSQLPREEQLRLVKKHLSGAA